MKKKLSRRQRGEQRANQGGLDSSANALEDKAKFLLRHSEGVIARLDKAGMNWLAESGGILTMLFKAANKDDDKTVAAMIELLKGQGWDRGLVRQAFTRTPTKHLKILT